MHVLMQGLLYMLNSDKAGHVRVAPLETYLQAPTRAQKL